ncbi:hypothetical protein TKK_0009377 [Trichogramma kaykai]|uniref:NFACT RNA-binding domain-containing protein n=1 Tax=Trichogramma kaykai TaxID=54128 RepID=A0ABD2WYZ1_9HYME
MKTRFNTFDITCSITELQKLIGMRVNQVYDIDNRAYLIRFQLYEEKHVLLLESGNRIHTTGFEWPKNVAPSGFTMKLRKHLKNKRLEKLEQIGVDRVIDLQFGTGEAAYHIILELYDRGNIILTDCNRIILNVLRPHTEGDKIRFAVKEKYPESRAHTKLIPTLEELRDIFKAAKSGETLKKVLNPHLEIGPSVLEHILVTSGLATNCKIGNDFDVTRDVEKFYESLLTTEKIFNDARSNVSKGYIVQKKQSKYTEDGKEEYLYVNVEFHPFLFEQFKDRPFKEFETFDKAVDEYFSNMEGQKLDVKALQQEREALKKLENVKKDHEKRLSSLSVTQEIDVMKAELITKNQELVDKAIIVIQSAIASQVSWDEIGILLKEAQARGDPVASIIKQLKLESNHITLLLSDPYEEEDSEIKPTLIDINLNLSAFGNATKYYTQKRSAASKSQKTIEAQGKALKSAERKTKQALKEVQTIHSINKVRKVYWFEKFYWFISSENYLVIGGRDQQQNELIVKRYLRGGDIYVHADISGASSIVIKNPAGGPVPPKTLAEAGNMAVAYSVAWEAKVVTGAWWVNSDQVSKTAPTGEYLTTGSFIIRGKKNYLPPCQLIMGFGFLFRLEDSSIERHLNERKVRTLDDDVDVDNVTEICNEIKIEDDDDEDIQEEDEEAEHFQKQDTPLNDKTDDDEFSFPDTQIKIDLSGPVVKLQVEKSKPIAKVEFASEDIVFLGDDTPIKINNEDKKDALRNLMPKVHFKQDQAEEDSQKKNQNALKRGQRGKLKKMKEKYKDQDEEDKVLAMAVLKSDGASKNKNKHKDPSGPKQVKKKKQKYNPNELSIQSEPSISQPLENIDEEDPGPGPEVDMLDQFTGKPVPEDELLFAVPVVAPYSTLTNYKFKVKLQPGNGKRGKAAKTALAMFMKDKSTLPREKDLIKAVKDESIARNIPGKVKISAPQIQKISKKN